MKSYINITSKYLKVQKKRSVLTVIGIILSVALITGVGAIFMSMFDAQMRVTIRENGSYHAAVKNVPGDKVGLLCQNAGLDTAGVAENMGFAAYATNRNSQSYPPYKYLSVMALDGNAMTLLPYELEEGRMPTADGELAVDYWTLKYMGEDVKLGSTIAIDLGSRSLPDGTPLESSDVSSPKEQFTKRETRQYKLVGLLKPRYIFDRNFGRAVAFLDPAALPKTDGYTVYLKAKSINDIQGQIKRMVSATGLTIAEGKSEVSFNDRILRLYAQSVNEMLNDTVIIVFGVIILLVIVATIAVIYNAFNISVIERVSQFGLLRCVGATPRQIRNIVFREALILGAIGIPIGIVCGTIAMAIVFAVISSVAPDMIMGGLRLVMSPYLVIASVLIGSFTIYLSAFLPARKAGRISPMEAVRGTGAFKKEKFRKSDRHRIVLRLLGAEGWMAWKNLGRNRKRFYVTVFSMVISIVLFIVFSSLVQFAFQSGAVESADVPSYTITTRSSRASLEISDKELATIRNMQGVDYVLRHSAAYGGEAVIPVDKLNDRAIDFLRGEYGFEVDGSDVAKLVNGNLLCYGDESYTILKQKLGIGQMDDDAFIRGDGIILINGAAFYDSENNKDVLTDLTKLSVGDTIDVSYPIPNEEGDESEQVEMVTRTVKVLAVVEEGLAGEVRSTNGGIMSVGSEKLFGELSRIVPYPSQLIVMMKDDADHSQIKPYLEGYDGEYNVYDYGEAAKSQMQVWVVLSIFLYGFVSVISLIGCLNIINTISTNIILRTRELSVMRAIGMAEGNVRKMIAMESILHGAAAALIGSVAGTALSWLVYSTMTSVREFPWTLPWQQILIAVGASALVAVISALVPLKRINSGIIMEGIRGEE